MAHKQSLALLFLAAVVSTGLLLLFSSAASAASVDLAKTGQTTCFSQTAVAIDCAGTGQDGEYQKGIPWPDPRFTNNEDGSITDNLTGLTWLQDAQCIGRLDWLPALDAVNALANGSCELTDGSAAGDWRMPNYLELISIANLGVSNSLAWFTSFGFTNVQGFGYWSSTSDIQIPSNAMLYQFNHRFSGRYSKTSSYQTWPVKGSSTGPAKIWKTGQTTCYDEVGAIDCAGTGQDGDLQTGEPMPGTRFIDNTDGTVTDNLTGLIWLQNANCFGPRIWWDALLDANSLADGACSLTDGSSAGNWRLPNPLEIVSLSVFSHVYPALPPGHPFNNVPTYGSSPWHWTSSSWIVLPSYAYNGNTTSYGFYDYRGKSEANSLTVWPVRDGNDTAPPDPVFADGFEEDNSSD